MFQFTTTNVINSLKDSSGKDLVVATEDGLQVKRVNTFKADNVTKLYRAKFVEPNPEKVEIDFSKITGATEGDPYRLLLYIGLTQASQQSTYSNDMIYKGKPVSLDFTWKGDNTATNIKKMINKYQVAIYGERLFNVEATGKKLTITAVNEYQRFKTVNIEKFDPEAFNGMGDYTPVLTLGKEGIELTSGVEGFGTYEYILHNLRLPTRAHTDAFALGSEEMPIVGGLYYQYTLHYCVNRGTLGMNGVGDQVTSHTTHVFYVLKDLVNNFESVLKAALKGDFVSGTGYDEMELPNLLSKLEKRIEELENA